MIQIVDRFPEGIVRIPLSKSEAHRALICAALAQGDCGESVLSLMDISEKDCSDDILATAGAIHTIVKSGGRGGVIDCGESGSTLRFLIPVAAMTGGEWIFKGRGRLLSRPMDIFEELFKKHGAHYLQTPDEIVIRGPLPVGVYELPGDVSSQFVTGLLMALPLAVDEYGGNSEIRLTSPLESAAYVALTTNALQSYGIRAYETREFIECKKGILGWSVPSNQKYTSSKVGNSAICGGDWSQAAFFLCAGALGCDVAVAGLDLASVQGDRNVLEIIEKMGARVVCQNGTVHAFHADGAAPLKGVLIDAHDIPDIVPPLAALACYAKGQTRFISAGRLRIKESDRLAALAEELAKLGADISETEDGLIVNGTGGEKLRGGSVFAHGDHRIAMAMAVAAIGCEGPVSIDGAESVSKSYPNFWNDFLKVYTK